MLNQGTALVLQLIFFVVAIGFGLFAVHNWLNQRRRFFSAGLIGMSLSNLLMMFLGYGQAVELPWLLLFVTFLTGLTAGFAIPRLFERSSV
jgi:hypothetical protein